MKETLHHPLIVSGGLIVLAVVALIWCSHGVTNQTLSQDHEVIVIYGCQYITIRNSFPIGNNYSFAITHKGDCTNRIHSR